MSDAPRPARDGETLSGEQVRIFRETFSQPESEVERLVLRLCDTVAALRAELADARADKERLDWLESELEREDPATAGRFSLPPRVPRSLFRKNVPITRAAIDAARASGEDASHD